MEIDIVFDNKVTGLVEAATVEPTDSLNSIFTDMEAAGLVKKGNIFKLRDGTVLNQNSSFDRLGISSGYTIEIWSGQEEGNQHGTAEEISNKDRPKLRSTPKAPKTFDQLGIFVLDGSYSMNGRTQDDTRKKDAVNTAMRELFKEFKKSGSAKNFSFAVVLFDTDASLKMDTTPLLNIDSNLDFDPTQGHNKNTRIHVGLTKAKSIAEGFLLQETAVHIPRSVVIVLLSDGECHEPETTQNTAMQIKQHERVRICTTFFSALGASNTDAETLMQTLASDASCYEKTYDFHTLRGFFERSLSKNL